MRRASIGLLIGFLIAGCQQQRVYQIDFNQAPGFHWDGKVRVIKTLRPRLGPLLIIEDDWAVDCIEFASRDGQSASIDTQGYHDVPIAKVGPATPTGTQILGTRGYWDGPSPIVLIMEPDSAQAFASKQQQAASKPTDLATVEGLNLRSVPEQLKPYTQHADQLTSADWWAIALEQADTVMAEFHVPGEQLRIVLRGDPRQYGPAIMEVWTTDGRLVKRIEQQQIAVEKIEPTTSHAQPQPAAPSSR